MEISNENKTLMETTVSTLNSILDEAIHAQASDIHLAVGIPPTIRVNGKLTYLGKAPLNNTLCSLYARVILSEEQFAKFKETGEYDTSYSHDGTHNFRVNVFRQKNNVGIVMRLISSKLPTLETLGLPAIFRSLCMKRSGLILVTGPTGSGKTTTLAAMIEFMIRTRNEHIITIEDPIEFIFPHGSGIVNQRQLGSDTANFEAAIRSALREDIDVMMVGEMRDLETINAALTAAETGHLVLSTVHTIGAAKTVDRIVDVFPAEQQSQVRVQLSTVLEAVISQQLLPNRMNNGRELALEIMVANHAISNLIREGKASQLQNLIQLGNAGGMVTMDQSLINLYRDGRIDEHTLYKYCIDMQEVRRQLGR